MMISCFSSLSSLCYTLENLVHFIYRIGRSCRTWSPLSSSSERAPSQKACDPLPSVCMQIFTSQSRAIINLSLSLFSCIPISISFVLSIIIYDHFEYQFQARNIYLRGPERRCFAKSKRLFSSMNSIGWCEIYCQCFHSLPRESRHFAS